MIKKTIGLIILSFCFSLSLFAQELYVFTEPASNMPAQSIGVRLTNEGMLQSEFRSRSIAEVMVGLNKNLMFHVQGFLSDMDGKYQLEGSSFYVKYRFLSLDNAQSHFRAAAFSRISSSKRKVANEDINLEGDNSGFQAGLIFTQLMHKLALSATLGYSKSLGEREKLMYDLHSMPGMEMPAMQVNTPNEILSYSLSSGYLLLPFVYKNYKQPNFNLYFEMLGRTNPANSKSTLDFAPALQVILNSKTRIDLGYRFHVAGNLETSYLKNMYLARVEFNFFNAFK